MAPTPHKLFRKVLDETGDPLAAIRAIRDDFGLSVAEAKEVGRQATGQAATLDAQQEELAAAPPRIVCPKCFSDTTIVRKLHALPPGLGYGLASNLSETQALGFVNGFWCTACQVGFVPDHQLKELGLVEVRPI